MKRIYPKLTLVGAGPGDAELITLKGMKAVGEADAVLYDALVNTDLLKYARPDARKMFVGKRSKNHIYSQDEINRLIVQHAFNCGHVVRLKGGDPFVFGRGMEEIRYAELFGIGTEVIPGISSSIGVPALCGIPVTHRGTSESFWVITGTTRTGKLSDDVITAAQTDATVVILMGIAHLSAIVQIYKEAGKSDTAIAVLQEGSLASQKIAVGKITRIENIVKKKDMKSPAVIVIGEVVKLNQNFPQRIAEVVQRLN